MDLFQKIKNAPGRLPEDLEVRPSQMQRLDKAVKDARDAERKHGGGSKKTRRARSVLQSTLRASGSHEQIAFGNKYRPNA